jgi:Domain of unknown function (DUF4397)
MSSNSQFQSHGAFARLGRPIAVLSAVTGGAIAALGALLAPASAAPAAISADARVQLVHVAPFSSTISGTSVSVLVNGSDVITDLVFGQTSSGYLTLTAGVPLTVEIVPTGSTTPAITASLTLSAGVDYTVAAIGDGTRQPLELLVLVDDNTVLTDSAKLRVVHVAPLSNTITGTLVDVRTEAGAPITVDFAYKANTGYLALPPGPYDLKVTLPNTGPTAIQIPPLRADIGDVLTVFAIGNGVSQPLGILPLGDLHLLGNGRAWVVHAAPFSDTLAGTAVSVTLSTELGASTPYTDFRFGQTSGGYISLLAGIPTTITITPQGADAPAITETVTLSEGVDYTLAAIGNGTLQPLELLTLIDDNSVLTGSAKLRIVHAAPFSAITSLTAVDVRLQSGTLITGGLIYKNNTGYLDLPGGNYDLRVTLAGTSITAIDPPPILLPNGQVMTVFAIGDGDAANFPLRALVLTANDAALRVYLPLISRSE